MASVVLNPLPVIERRSFRLRRYGLANQFLRDAYSYAARGFCEDTFGFGQQLDRFHDFRIGGVFGPTAALQNLLRRIISVRRISDRQ